MKLFVQEIFDTVQGEGTYTGTPATFIRLQGCVVGCAFCDTKHTWSTTEGEIPWPDKTQDEAALVRQDWSKATVEQIIAEVADRLPRHVVLTGGEPAAQDIRPLCLALIALGKTVQLETSGTYPIDVPHDVWVTVSPKINKPGGRVVLPDAMYRANEIKHPVGRGEDVAELQTLLGSLGRIPEWVPIYLQPLSQSKAATALCVEVATKHGWRISVQVHKYIGLP